MEGELTRRGLSFVAAKKLSNREDLEFLPDPARARDL
jgi:hypothetical protein